MKYIPLYFAITAMAITANNASAQSSQTEPSVAPAPVLTKLHAASPKPKFQTASKNEKASPVLSFEELNEMRGGTQIAVNTQTLNAENNGHVINGDFAAGDVNLADDAFANFNGLGNFVFNTGAQSSLQAGMSVTINIGE